MCLCNCIPFNSITPISKTINFILPAGFCVPHGLFQQNVTCLSVYQNVTCPSPHYIPTFQSYSVSTSLVLTLYHSFSWFITISHSFTIFSIVWQFYSLLPQSFYSFCTVQLFIHLYTTVFTVFSDQIVFSALCISFIHKVRTGIFSKI